MSTATTTITVPFSSFPSSTSSSSNSFPAAPPHQVSNVFEKNGKLFLKTFLIDSSVNGAKWGIMKDYIPKHIQRFVGRPYILTQGRSHPLEFYGAIHEDYNDIPGTINRYLQAQEKYRIGTIRKVEPITIEGVESASGSIAANGWAAYVEITDPLAIQSFRAGNIPRYVSPTVFRMKRDDPPDKTTDYEPLHLAAVDIPAYGVEKAGIRGSCVGDITTCSKHLAQASSTSSPSSSSSISSPEDCGFCIKGTLEGFENRFLPSQTNTSNDPTIVHSSFVTFGLNQATEKLTETNSNNSVPAQGPNANVSVDTSRQEQQPSSSQQQQLSPTTPTTTITSNSTGNGQPFKTTVDGSNRKASTVATTSQQEQEKEDNDDNDGNTNNHGNSKTVGTESKDKSNSNNKNSPSNKGGESSNHEINELKGTVQALLQKVTELESFKQNSERTELDKRLLARRAKIESTIPENYANSPDERTKAIDVFMKYDNDDQLDYILQTFVAPTVTQKQQQQQGLKKGGLNDRNRGVRQASSSSSPSSPAASLTEYTNGPQSKTISASATTSVQQAAAAAASFDFRRMARICAMSNIVAGSSSGGGA